MSIALTAALPRPACKARTGLRAAAAVVAGIVVAMLPCETQNAVANGDTRTIHLYHAHTHESIDATFLVNGSYDQSVLDKLNWFLRDWRRDEPTKMDPKLFDVIWEVYREAGSRQPIEVMSAYRSPETNAMLRRRSRGVAEHSQHILGKAMDQHYIDVPMSRIREIAMRLQRGGVGFYPTAGTPFVHMDVGGVRHWPRMSYDQLARLFPDGKTVHIPSNGQPLPGYEMARAELESRGGESYPTASAIKSKGFFAWLFGGGSDEDEDVASEGGGRGKRDTAGSRNTRVAMVDRGGSPVASYDPSSKDGGSRSFFASQSGSSSPPATPYGRVAREIAQPVPAPAPEPTPAVPQPDPTAAAPQTEPAADTSRPSRLVADLASPSQTVMSNGLAVPVPPRRPMELAALADLPMPPVRPAELSRPVEGPAPTPGKAKADGIAALLGGKGPVGSKLPSVILQGTAEPRGGLALMAYAGGLDTPAAVPLPVARPGDLVGARLDRANFRSLTSGTKTDKSAGQVGLGPTVVGVRAASRASLNTLAAGSRQPGTFAAKASELSTDRFTGAAVKPEERFVTARRADAAGRPSPD